MSLLSQQDRQLAIKALEHYKTQIPIILNISEESIECKTDEQKLMEINALINWIKLEYQKNEN